MGVHPNQIGPLNEPLVYKSGVPYPNNGNLVSKGYADFLASKTRKEKYIPPVSAIDNGDTLYQLPRPFLKGSIEVLRNGVLEPLDSVTELNNISVQISTVPQGAPNRESLVFIYFPFVQEGAGNQFEQMTLSFSVSQLLTTEMISNAVISGNSNVAPVVLTLPTMSSLENGSRILVTQQGTQNVEIVPDGADSIDNLIGSLILNSPGSSVELIYSFNSNRWNRVGR